MKKNLFNLILIAALFMALAATCNKEKHVTSVSLSPTTLVLAVGDNSTLKGTVQPDDAVNKNIIWTTDKKEVATVDNGLVVAVAIGTATITATSEDGNCTAQCKVTVIHPGESIMIAVAGGTFTMGCTDNESNTYTAYERPTHQVTLSAFQMAQYPVTQKQWKAIMGDNPSHFKGDNLPIENVSWHDAQTFIKRLNEITHKKYRLPTEAEWEYACRGGAKSAQCKYSGSNNLELVAWYTFNSDNMTHPVGKMASNELKIYDMSGNVWEWCQDWAAQYDASAQTNPQGAAAGSCRIIRGGSYHSDYLLCRVSYRDGVNPNQRNPEIGFRLVLQ